MLDDSEDLLFGDDTEEVQHHKFRFETYSDNIEWVLTDIDDCLKGNSYIQDKDANKSH